jgi:hypothetical protein
MMTPEERDRMKSKSAVYCMNYLRIKKNFQLLYIYCIFAAQ